MPATSFCEPNGDVKPATWHWFSVKGTEPRPLFAFPGIWRRYKGPKKKGGPVVEIDTYSFLTTTPNGLVAMINHERMPVLLRRIRDVAERIGRRGLRTGARVSCSSDANRAGGIEEGRLARRVACESTLSQSLRRCYLGGGSSAEASITIYGTWPLVPPSEAERRHPLLCAAHGGSGLDCRSRRILCGARVAICAAFAAA